MPSPHSFWLYWFLLWLGFSLLCGNLTLYNSLWILYWLTHFNWVVLHAIAHLCKKYRLSPISDFLIKWLKANSLFLEWVYSHAFIGNYTTVSYFYLMLKGTLSCFELLRKSEFSYLLQEGITILPLQGSHLRYFYCFHWLASICSFWQSPWPSISDFVWLCPLHI